jgi:ubiquinone/menaquinone biosynthesis C-methylase UbiE
MAELERHYAAKYQEVDAATIIRAPIREHPRDRFEMAAKMVNRHCGGRLLEVGAGYGNCALSTAELFDEVVLTELTDNRVNVLKSVFTKFPNVRVIKNNLENGLPEFENNFFDTVLLSAVVEHLIDPIQALRELSRVIKPGGVLLVDTPNIAKWTRRIKLLFGYFPSTASLSEGWTCYDRKTATNLHDEGHLHYFTFRSLRKMLIERCGFRTTEVYGYGSLLGRTIPALFSEIFVVAYK